MKRPNQTTHRHLIFEKGSVYMKKRVCPRVRSFGKRHLRSHWITHRSVSSVSGQPATVLDPGFSTSSNQRSVPDQVQPFAGVYGCSTTAARGVSSHVAPERQIGWCGNGYWTGPAIGGTYRFQNKSGTTATIGENWIIAALCPGYTTCNFASSFNLRHVAY